MKLHLPIKQLTPSPEGKNLLEVLVGGYFGI